MNAHRPAAAALAAAITTFAFAAAPSEAGVQRADQPIDGRYIVVLQKSAVRPPNAAPDDTRKNLGELAKGLAEQHGGRVGRRYGHALQGFTFQGDAASAEQLAADPTVAYVVEDGWVHVSGKPAPQQPPPPPPPPSPSYGSGEQTAPPSWGLDRVDQRSAALDSLYGYAADGTGIDIYLVDTGIRSSHSEFAGRIDTSAAFSAIADGLGTEDCNGHGTHTAGIAAGATYGVAKKARLHPVRVLDCYGYGTISNIVAGIDWIKSRHATKPTRAVVNLSFATTWTQALDEAVANSVAAGITYVVAAGNGGGDACVASPARTPSAITVGASDRSGARAAFSNYGACVDLFAPGEAIVSSFAATDTDLITMSGTSMAAPHVAGTAALALSVNPNLTPAQVSTLITAAASADQLAGVGAGSANKLLYAPFTGVGVDMAPVASFTFSCLSGTCSFNATGSADDRGIVSYAWDFGNTKTGSGATISHKYARTSKSVTVTLTVKDTVGRISTIQKLVQTGS
jgi:serine protease